MKAWIEQNYDLPWARKITPADYFQTSFPTSALPDFSADCFQIWTGTRSPDLQPTSLRTGTAILAFLGLQSTELLFRFWLASFFNHISQFFITNLQLKYFFMVNNWIFPCKIKTRISTLIASIQHCIEDSSQGNKVRKKYIMSSRLERKGWNCLY